MTLKFKPLANPILIVGDNPSLAGGLSRICRDLATLACTMPEFRVGVLGRGEGNRAKFPFVLYPYDERHEWGQQILREVWWDFAGQDHGLVLTTDDPSRRVWFADPSFYPQGQETFLGEGRQFRKVGYFPLDSVGPGGERLGIESRNALAGYDRVLVASEWGRNLVQRSGRGDADWLPHGFHGDKFHPVPEARAALVRNDAEVWLGCAMANQARKDFPVLFECAAVLKAHYGGKFRLWLHTSSLIGYWNVYALAADYGVQDCLDASAAQIPDEMLAMRYSACDCTMLPSASEGFGYPILESLACGTACIVTDYAAGQELVPEAMRVAPVAYRVDTAHNVVRAVISGYGFARAAIEQIELKRQDREFRSQELAETVSHLEWGKLRFLWERWLRECLR